jgi:Rps23 Pro-64 3,4-dihydroxylase Tpa1-like proline 4-hydroxylase
MERKVLHKNIHYYEGAVLDPYGLIEKIESIDHLLSAETGISKWADWTAYQSTYAFGKQKMIREHFFNKNHEAYNECRYIEKEITDAIMFASKDYESMHLGLDIGMLCPMSISKYFVGSQMGKHTDTHDDDEGKTISVVLYLNDDYTGGEIEFEDQGLLIKPTAGSIMVFPSRKPYFHASKPVLSGEKYIVPGFWENRVQFQTGWQDE